MRSRPKHDGTEGVEGEAHQDGDLVALALEDLSRDGGEAQVTAAEVHAGGLLESNSHM